MKIVKSEILSRWMIRRWLRQPTIGPRLPYCSATRDELTERFGARVVAAAVRTGRVLPGVHGRLVANGVMIG